MDKIQLKPARSQKKQRESVNLPKPSSSIALLTKPSILSTTFVPSVTLKMFLCVRTKAENFL